MFCKHVQFLPYHLKRISIIKIFFLLCYSEPYFALLIHATQYRIPVFPIKFWGFCRASSLQLSSGFSNFLFLLTINDIN